MMLTSMQPDNRFVVASDRNDSLELEARSSAGILYPAQASRLLRGHVHLVYAKDCAVLLFPGSHLRARGAQASRRPVGRWTPNQE